jgi:predicted MPP superfamily phosphohydrolase
MTASNLFLWLGVAVGHTAVLISLVNRWYGRPLPHRFLDAVRLVHGACVPALLAGLWLTFGWDLGAAVDFSAAETGRRILAGYLVLCCAVAYGVLPAITLWRLRRRPAALVQNHTRTIDIASRLGYRPLGHGKYRFMARLPGNELFRVDFAEKVLRVPGLPSVWDGLTVVHLSDLHFGGTPDREFYLEVMDVCREWNPDLVALTGDVVDSDHHHRWVLPVIGRLKWRLGAFAILGNHDRWYEPNLVRRRLRKGGFEVLSNRWRQVEVRGENLIVIGHEGPWMRPAPDLAGCPESPFRLCLSHTPDNLPWAKRHHVNLVLSGHNHGGQVRLPLLGSVLVPSRFGRRYDCGTFDEGRTVLHVVRGLAAQHPLRYNCRPEVAKLVLRPA